MSLLKKVSGKDGNLMRCPECNHFVYDPETHIEECAYGVTRDRFIRIGLISNTPSNKLVYTDIESIEYINDYDDEVYDLEIEDNHNYFAENHLVHNCHKLVLEGLFGSVYQVTETKKLINDQTLADFNIKAITLKYPDDVRKGNKGKSYQEEIDWIVRNESRNKFIRNLAWSLKGNTLVLFQYVDKHGKVLYPLLENTEKNVHFVHGGVDTQTREDIRSITESSSDNIILASYGVFSTGINIKRLDNIIFASPSKSKIRNLQSIGRVLRRGNGKEKATLYDIVDDLQWKSHQNFAVQHFMERVKTYSNEGFDFKIYNVDLK